LRLDFGGIAKGYTAQQAVELLGRWGPCLVNAGGDLTAGLAPLGFSGWPVAIAKPWAGIADHPSDLMTLWLTKGSLATSGVDYRRWRVNGREAHHLIDPRTGSPAQTDLLTASVLACRATEAEAWATAALVAGSEQGLTLLTEAEIAAVLVRTDGQIIVTPAMALFLATPE
jgi:thiamine biosynthesis lipoprotein